MPYPYKGQRRRDRRISSRSITAWGNAGAPYPICRSAVVDMPPATYRSEEARTPSRRKTNNRRYLSVADGLAGRAHGRGTPTVVTTIRALDSRGAGLKWGIAGGGREVSWFLGSSVAQAIRGSRRLGPGWSAIIDGITTSQPVRLVLFDLDGTLIDHDGAAAAGVKQWIMAKGWADDQTIADLVSDWQAIQERHFTVYQARRTTFQGQRRLRLKEFLPRVGIDRLALVKGAPG